MNAEEKLVLHSIRRLTGICNDKGTIEYLLNHHRLDWKKVKEIAIYHEILPVLYVTLKNHSALIPVWFMKILKNNFTYNISRNSYLLQKFLRLLYILKDNNIQVLPIKGMRFLLEDIYPDFSLRYMTDIDILVRWEDVRKAEAILYQLQYQKDLLGLDEDYWRKRQFHLTFCKKIPSGFTLILELHWALDYKRKKQVLPNLWKRLKEVRLNKQKIYVLSPEDTIFCLSLHNRRFGKTLSLKNAIDFILLLNRYKSLDWDYIRREAKSANIRCSLSYLFLQAKFAGAKLPQEVEEFGVPLWKRKLIFNFIKNNTFLIPHTEKEQKNLFLKSHFLLYDNFWEPIEYILNIPEEQFAKFYTLVPYSKKTKFFYRNRLFYIPIRFVFKK